MLETVLDYARERLDTKEDAAAIQGRHCRYYLALIERAEPELYRRAQAELLPLLDAEIQHFRVALRWSIRDGDASLGVHLAGLLYSDWHGRPLFTGAMEQLDLAKPG